MESVVSEFEGTLIKEHDPFSYLMLVAFEASGLIRFALLLMLWPLIRLLEGETGLKLTIFVAVARVREAEIESVARAVLPKFYSDDADLEAWKVFNSCGKRVVVTEQPRIMVETFLKKHLLADEVLGTELVVNKFGFATGFTEDGVESIRDRVAQMFVDDERPSLGVGRVASNSFLTLCNTSTNGDLPRRRLVKRPTPATALLIILWIPIGIIFAATRILISVALPMRAVLPAIRLSGNSYAMRGNPPVAGKNSGVLFVCNHRTLVDPVALSIVLGRKVPALTYSLSRVSEVLSPIPTVRLTRNRDVDARRIEQELARGDLVVCPEGTTCREPFLLRFSALFAELTDRIVPVAMNYRSGGFFHATTARGWKGLDIVFYAMNPRPVYEFTFLDKLPAEATCSAGKSPYDVANYVQRALAATLGFECTNFTRKDKYRILAGNDGTVS